MSHLTSEEVVLLVNYVHEKLIELTNGDWEANKQDIADMHRLAAKIISMQKP